MKRKQKFFPTRRVTGPPKSKDLQRRFKQGEFDVDIYLEAKVVQSVAPPSSLTTPKTPKDRGVFDLMRGLREDKVKITIYVFGILVS